MKAPEEEPSSGHRSSVNIDGDGDGDVGGGSDGGYLLFFVL